MIAATLSHVITTQPAGTNLWILLANAHKAGQEKLVKRRWPLRGVYRPPAQMAACA